MEPLEYTADEIIYCDNENLRFNYWIPQIQPKTIINKVIPGFGATYTEIKDSRNSIIVLPNVATIHSKHDSKESEGNTFPVYEGVSTKHIIDYLKGETPKKKLLTTPESLHKIIRAFEQLKINGFKEYFILMDESHKLIQDVDYRPSITLAMDYFFLFDNNAMISSTPIKPSDPRFSSFKHIKLQPLYKYDKPIDLLYHNNVVYALKNCFERHPAVAQCVFFNSINGIVDLIKKLGIGDDSTIFCSKESAGYLQTLQYSEGKFFDAAFKFEADQMKKYNFFTSSLYNGLDIILDEPPQVILISLPTEPKTYLDPFTDVIQILGRFRKHDDNKGGIYAEAIHLLPNWATGVFKLKDQVNEWVVANQSAYNTILSLMYSSIDELTKSIYRGALKRLPFHSLLANEYHLHRNNPAKPNYPDVENPDLYNLDYFKLDNLYEEERVNSYYGNGMNLWHAYQQAGLLDEVNNDFATFNVLLNERTFSQDELPKLNLKSGKRYSKHNVKQLVDLLIQLQNIEGNYDIYDEAVFNLTKHYSLVRIAYDTLGLKKIVELDYNMIKMKQALIDHDVKAGKNQTPIIDSVYVKFSLGFKIPLVKIKQDLQSIYDHYNIKAIAKATDMHQWFDLKEVKIVSKAKDGSPAARVEQRAYILLSHKFNMNAKLKRG